MASMFITLRGTALEGIYKTQAKATAAALRDTDVTAHVGAIEVPDNAERGWVLKSGALVHPENAQPGRTPLEALKATVRAAQELQYGSGGVYDRVEHVGRIFPYALKADVEDILLCGEYAFYIDMTNSVIPVARRLDLASKVLLGPTEVTHDPADEETATRTLYRTVRDNALPTGFSRGIQPARFQLWDMDASVYNRRAYAASLTAARTEFPRSSRPNFDTVNLRGDAWIDGIT